MPSPVVKAFEHIHIGCHGEEHKCFHLGQNKMKICARCTGCIIGHCSAILSAFFISYTSIIFVYAFCFLLIMLADWLMQNKYHLYHSNFLRLITGCLGGFAVAVVFVKLFLLFFN